MRNRKCDLCGYPFAKKESYTTQYRGKRVHSSCLEAKLNALKKQEEIFARIAENRKQG